MPGTKYLTSRYCPSCGSQCTVEISEAQATAYRNGAYIQDILVEYPASTRERFISGYCAGCWEELFGDFDEEGEDD